MAHKSYRPAPRRSHRPRAATAVEQEHVVPSTAISPEEEVTLEAARAVACRVVADQWPDLAGVEPTVAPRHRAVPPQPVLDQLGLDKQAIAERATDYAEYTFTFAAETRTPEGYRTPRIARITVDSQRRVVKATISK